MNRPLTAAFLWTLASVAHGQDGCAPLLQFIAHSAPGPPLAPMASPVTCDQALSEDGSVQVFCYWGFPLRDPAAIDTADRFARDILRCLPGAGPLPADSGVNHPDSYDLRRFRRDAVIISVSVKDKTALNRTLVFLRAEKARGQ